MIYPRLSCRGCAYMAAPASKPPLLLPSSSCPSLPCPQPLPLSPTSPPNPTLQRPLPASAGTNPARRQPPHRIVGCRQSALPLLPLPQPPAGALAALAPPPCVLPLHPLQFRTPPALPLPGPPHLLLPTRRLLLLPLPTPRRPLLRLVNPVCNIFSIFKVRVSDHSRRGVGAADLNAGAGVSI